jgi:SagB-type dehydrogenase family enzyme
VATIPEQRADFTERARVRELPALYTTNPPGALRLPAASRGGVFRWLAARRTARDFRPGKIPLAALADCLHAGLGITGFGTGPLGHRMPLKMTPSGGALNPYEAYVLAPRVAGLSPGVYHYSAVDGTLGLRARPPLPQASDLLCEQAWADGAAACIFLVANHERSMWKYGHPMVYRTVLIEAGHIGQNVMLAATQHGLSAAPSDFPRDARVEKLLGLDRIMQSVVYVLVLGKPRPG